MVQFDELKFNTEGNLVIKVSVPDKDYFADVYLDTIKIDTQTTFDENGPSDTCVYSKTIEAEAEDNSEESKEEVADTPSVASEGEPSETGAESTTGLKSFEITLTPLDILSNIDGNIFFVWATAKGTPASSTPCGQDIAKKVMPVLDKRYIYKMFTPLLKTLQCDCGDSKEFTNLMLKWKAVEYNLLAGNYTQAIEYWQNFFTQINKVRQTKSCGCNGKSL